METENQNRYEPFRLIKRNIILIGIFFLINLFSSKETGAKSFGLEFGATLILVIILTILSYIVWSASKSNNKRAQTILTVLLVLFSISKLTQLNKEEINTKNQITKTEKKLQKDLADYRKGNKKEYPDINPYIEKVSLYLKSHGAKTKTLQAYKEYMLSAANISSTNMNMMRKLYTANFFTINKLNKKKIYDYKKHITQLVSNLSKVKHKLDEKAKNLYSQKEKESNLKIILFIERFYSETQKINLFFEYSKVLVKYFDFLSNNWTSIHYNKKENRILFDTEDQSKKYNSILKKIIELKMKFQKRP